MGKKADLSDFECGMVVGARRAGLSISKTADLLGFSHATVSRVYREWSKKEKISSERQLCGWKCLVDVRGQRRMDRLVRDDRKATVTQITTRYNQDMQNTISEHTTRQTLKQMDSSSRRPHRVLLRWAKNRKRRLQFAQTGVFQRTCSCLFDIKNEIPEEREREREMCACWASKTSRDSTSD